MQESEADPPSALRYALVVACNPCHATSLTELLRQVGYIVHLCSDPAAWTGVCSVPQQVAILVSSKPYSQIEGACSRIRREAPNLPLIVLGPDEVMVKVRFFELGADDYVVEPFDRLELLTRIRSLIRRHMIRSGSCG